MAVTDLTGTTWVINSTIPNTAGNRYSITFTTKGQTAYYLDNINRLVYGIPYNNKYHAKYIYFHSVGTRVDCTVKGGTTTTATLYYKKRGDSTFDSAASAGATTVESYIYLDAQTEYVFVDYMDGYFSNIRSMNVIADNSTKKIAVTPANFQDSSLNDLTGINILSYSYLFGARTEETVFVPQSNYGWMTTPYGYSSYVRYRTLSAGWVDEAYRTIEITGGTDVTNADLIAWLQSNATQVLPGVSVEVNLKELNLAVGAHSFTAKAKVTGKADSAASSPAISYTLYSITNSITGGTSSGDAKVSSTGSSTVTITPTSGYSLPSTITVNGVTGSSGSTGCTWSYDSTTGIITLSQASANITISATCTQPQLNTPSMSLSGNILTLTSSDDRGEYYDIYNNTTLLTSVSTSSTISFTIGNTTFEADSDMTWGDWISSNYNTAGYVLYDGIVQTSSGFTVQLDGMTALSTDTIVENGQYAVYGPPHQQL